MAVHRLVAPVALVTLALAATSLRADEKPRQAPDARFVGTWTLVSVDNIQPDGSRTQPYGPGPQGILMFDAEGRYALQIFRADRPKFASNDKSHGTAAEYEAAVNGANSHFGRFVVDEAGKSITFAIEHASFPNWEGTEQKRSFTLVGDELTYTVPVTTNATAAAGEVKWRRAH